MYFSIIIQSLIDIGLSPLAAELYYDTLTIPNTSVTDLAKKYGVHREKVYFTRNELVESGLAKYLDNNKKFVLESPTLVLTKIKQKKSKYSRAEKDFGDVLPDLLPIFDTEKTVPVIQLYEGEDQFYGVFDKFIEEAKDEIICFVNPQFFHDIIGLDYLDLWIKKRIEKSLSIRIISTAENAHRYRLTTENPKRDMRLVKFLKEGENNFKGTFYMSGGRVTIWNPMIPKAISIQDKVIAQTIKFMFDQIWNSLE